MGSCLYWVIVGFCLRNYLYAIFLLTSFWTFHPSYFVLILWFHFLTKSYVSVRFLGFWFKYFFVLFQKEVPMALLKQLGELYSSNKNFWQNFEFFFLTLFMIVMGLFQTFLARIWEIYSSKFERFTKNALIRSVFELEKCSYFLNGSEFRQKLIGTIIITVFPTKWAITWQF